MHDFDIELVDGRCVAVEVTSAVDGDIIELQNTAFGNEWLAPELCSDWWIGVPEESTGLRLRASHRAIVSVLSALEAHDIAEIPPDWVDYGIPLPLPAVVAKSVESLFELGVDWARSMEIAPEGRSAQLHFLFHGGASADFEQLHQVVLERVKAKLLKLERATADERHLFVWLDSTYPNAELAVATLPPPAVAPELPSALDVVWLATSPFGDPHRIWKLTAASGWRVIK